MSIVLGVVHMCTGVSSPRQLRASGQASRRRPARRALVGAGADAGARGAQAGRILTDFLPQILYMLSIFGPPAAPAAPPSRLLSGRPAGGRAGRSRSNAHQQEVQRALLAVALLSVLYMLTPKPVGANLAKLFQASQRARARPAPSPTCAERGGGGGGRRAGAAAGCGACRGRPRAAAGRAGAQGPSGPGSTTSEESYLSPDGGSGAEGGPQPRTAAPPAGAPAAAPAGDAPAVLLADRGGRPVAHARQRRHQRRGSELGDDVRAAARLDEGFSGEAMATTRLGHDEHDDGLVHQLIHAVEFILGGIQHRLLPPPLALSSPTPSSRTCSWSASSSTRSRSLLGHLRPVAVFVAFAVW
eukprot:tig00000950_g5772.t1